MTYFLQNGDAFFPTPSKESLLARLPAGNYTIEESMTGLFFQRAADFPAPPKVYGMLAAWNERIHNTFASRDKNTGVLLSGLKGSGKSLLGRLVACKARDLNIPTILVNKPYPGDKLTQILSTLTEPALIFFDEFEKVYSDHGTQESILSLLDGTSGTKHLFLLTVNDVYRVDTHMKNRPGRLYYSIDFKGLDNEFVREYGLDNLNNKDAVEEVVKLAGLFEQFNFDMLKALVEEMNLYNEPAREAVKLLNITPAENIVNYVITLQNKEGEDQKLYHDQWRGNALFMESHTVEIKPEDEDDDDVDYEMVTFTNNDLVSFNAASETYHFQTHDGYRVTMKAQTKKAQIHWSTALEG